MLAYPVWILRLGYWWFREVLRRPRRPPLEIAFLLESAPPEPAPAPRRFWQRFLRRPSLTVQALGEQLRLVTAEPGVRGVTIHLRPMGLSSARVDALRALIAQVRAAGVRVTCWAPGYTASTYQVACAADQVLLQPGGMVGTLGLTAEYVFLAEALEFAGVGVDLLQVSPYKTAGDPLTRRALTPEAREMADWLADDVFAARLAAIATGRGLDEAAARAAVDGSPHTDEQALAARLVDAVVPEEELPERLGRSPVPWPAARRRLPRTRPVRPGRVVGLIRVEGTIVDGRSRQTPLRPPVGLPLLFDDQCGDLTVVEQARALAADRRVGAVVLWVESGGGSASASEAMAAALERLAARKPLVAVMGTVAASGGYYVTTPARRVLAHPGTLTGSIGVLFGKVVAGGLLDRLLLHREVIQRGEHASMWSSERPFSEVERQKVGELLDRTYRQFLGRVAAGRCRSIQEIEPLAGGRVWTGRQALARGLVDELGGLEDAVATARRLAGLAPDAPLREVRHGRREPVPEPVGTAAILAHALRAVAALQQAGAWCLCPLVPPER